MRSCVLPQIPSKREFIGRSIRPDVAYRLSLVRPNFYCHWSTLLMTWRRRQVRVTNDYVTRDVMTDTKASSCSRLVGPPSPAKDDRDPTAASARWQRGRRRLASFLRPSVESNVVVLVSSGLATTIAILLAVNVYRLHDRVRFLELHCVTRPTHWTQNASSGLLDQVYVNKSASYHALS